jgi:hypothetical protein
MSKYGKGMFQLRAYLEVGSAMSFREGRIVNAFQYV